MSGVNQPPPKKVEPALLAALGRCAFAAGGNPSACVETMCRLHNFDPPSRGPVSAPRLRLQLAAGENCARELEHVGAQLGEHLTQEAVAVVMGVSKQAIAQTERRAKKKFQRLMRKYLSRQTR